MIGGARTGLGGWQTTLADLALILFLISASALDRQSDPPPPSPVPELPELGAPAAIWHEGPDAPALATWLAREQHDARLQVTLLVTRKDGTRALAMAAGLPAARVVVQPADGRQPGGIIAVLAYDRMP